MVFKRLLGAIGVGGPSVDTVLDGGAALPGGTLSGQVHLRGGGSAVEIEHIGLELVARVEAEHGEGESEGAVAFARFTVGGGFRLGEEEQRSVPFSVPLPLETPITELYGQQLGIVLGVRTELAVAGAKDKGDLDQLAVRPLPVQEAILEALGQLGFGFRSADLEYGRIGGTGQQLPFHQEIELTPAPRYAHAVNEIELTFLASPEGVEIVLEADKRGGPFSSGHDTLTRFTAGHHEVHTRDWYTEVDGWIAQLIEHRAAYGAGAMYGAPAPAPYTGHHDGPYGDQHGSHYTDHHRSHHDGHHGGHRSGPGVGTAVAAGAAGLAVGVVGGLVAAEVVDEIGDFFEDEEDESGDDGA
ncbi:sporulation protein [Streptomyces gibsoniae]|uniref:Sporulation protein n=1 Tax=Streptomyces gibsoniae TaxID=3075529 RepID=A0ABU2TZR6_9ACTN|nr:sporulation protein [Streptomyces sp. DSM 41699]MDT0466345.1 sporulation protein [Streptomyces sp. DSM 41699]